MKRFVFYSLLASAALLWLTADAPARPGSLSTAPVSRVPAGDPRSPDSSGDPSPVSFRDATEASGIQFVHHDAPPMPEIPELSSMKFGTGAAVSDYDRDGDPDVYIVDNHLHPNQLYRNNGNGTFTEVAESAGVDHRGYGRMALFLDLDNDGFDDLVVANDADGRNQFPLTRIYRNRGDGTFEDVTVASGIEPIALVVGGMTAGDYDLDGDLDLYSVNWFDTTWLASQNYLYRNDGGFQFTDVTEDAGLRGPVTALSTHWSPLFADIDGDGWPDLFAAVDFVADYVFLNNGNGTFTYKEQEPGSPYHDGNDMGVGAADFDADGDIDFYTTNVTGEEGDPEECCNWLYVNDGSGNFVNEAYERGISDTRWGWGTWFFDADLDADLDLLAVNGWQQPEWITPASFFLNDGTGHFDEMAAECGIDHVGNSRSLTPIDFDSDGDMDFLITDVQGPASLYENVTDRGSNRFLVVRLEGGPSNRNGVGARVYVTTTSTPTRTAATRGERGRGSVEARTQMVEIMAGGSFYAGPPLEAHFGLGSVSTIDEVRVSWPSGAETVLTEVLPDQFLTLVEPPGEAARHDGRRPVPRTLPNEPARAKAEAFRLSAGPSPFRHSAVITYHLPEQSAGSLEICDPSGRRLRSFSVRGTGSVTWNGRDQGGAEVAAGAYFIRLVGEGELRTTRLLRLP